MSPRGEPVFAQLAAIEELVTLAVVLFLTIGLPLFYVTSSRYKLDREFRDLERGALER